MQHSWYLLRIILVWNIISLRLYYSIIWRIVITYYDITLMYYYSNCWYHNQKFKRKYEEKYEYHWYCSYRLVLSGTFSLIIRLILIQYFVHLQKAILNFLFLFLIGCFFSCKAERFKFILFLIGEIHFIGDVPTAYRTTAVLSL